MKKKSRKERNTLAKQVRDLPLEQAIDCAIYGRSLSAIEAAACHFLEFYYSTQLNADADVRYCGASKRSPHWDNLADEVLRAAKNRDGAALRELANIVERFDEHKPSADRTRFLLMAMKQSSLQSGEKFTLKDLAAMLRLPADADLTRLRAIAKEVQFPLACGKVGAPPKQLEFVAPRVADAARRREVQQKIQSAIATESFHDLTRLHVLEKEAKSALAGDVPLARQLVLAKEMKFLLDRVRLLHPPK